MSNKFFFGIILIFIGISILGSLVFSLDIARFWPVLIILSGIISVFQNGTQRAGSVATILIGSLFLIISLDLLNQDMIKYILPAVFVGLGLLVIFGRDRAAPQNTQNRITYLALLGGAKDTVSSQNFEGGSVMTVMGGAEIDLIAAKMQNPEANLEIITIMGGVQLKVPINWEIKVSGTPIMGGWDNKTSTQTAIKKDKVLNISITSIMGGVEIRN